jgi:hypothetical protein
MGSMTGKTHSEETKEKMRQARLGRKFGPLSEEHKKNLSLAFKGKPGKPLSEETKQKISLAKLGSPAWNKGIPQSPEAKEKNRLSNTGKTHSEETKKKMSLAQGVPNPKPPKVRKPPKVTYSGLLREWQAMKGAPKVAPPKIKIPKKGAPKVAPPKIKIPKPTKPEVRSYWKGTILTDDGATYNLGTFASKVQAEEAFERVARSHFGNFAKLKCEERIIEPLHSRAAGEGPFERK